MPVAGGAAGDRLLEAPLEETTVRQLGEVVGDRLTAGLVERAQVTERERGAQQSGEDRQQRQSEGEVAEMLEMVSEHAHRGQGERTRNEQRAEALGARQLRRALRRLPGREREQRDAGHVEDVGDAARGRRAPATCVR